MTVLTEQNLRTVLDHICARPKLGAAMAAIGASEKLIFLWLRRSAKDDPATLVRWPDETSEPIQFKDAVALARKQHLLLFDATLRQDVEEGIERVITEDKPWGGKGFAWVEDEALSHLTDEQIKAAYELGCLDAPDRFLRVNNKRVPLTVREPAPAMLRMHAARSLMPSAWNPETKVASDLNISGGVIVTNQFQRAESALVRDLRARLAKLEASGPARPTPTMPVPIAPPDPPQQRHDAEGVGYGDVIPGGVKVR